MSLYNDASLVMIPSAYKNGKLYSIKPTDGSGDFTFSRGSNLAATRVDENGLIEKGRENLLLQSNSFDTTWVNVNTTEIGGQVGYDGSSAAWLLSKSAAGGRIYQNITGSGIVTSSIYLKANASNWGLLQLDGTPDAYIYVDLINGVSGSTGSGNIDATITSVGGGWYRVSVTTNSTTRIRIYPAEANGDVSGTSGSIYIQDAQLEVGLVATDYIETTTTTAQAGILEDMPRLDYSGGASCPSLLLEPQRTNALNHSEHFGAWTQLNTITTDNAAASPEGVQNAAKLIASSGTSNKVIYQGITANTYTASVFAKKGELEGLLIATGTTGAFFNLNTQSFRADYSAPVTSYKIENYGNGWFRYSITFTEASGNNLYIGPNDNVSTSLAIAGDGTSGIYIYGAMLEVGSYPTSYIPCYGAATTRSSENMLDLTLNYGNTFSALFDLSGLGGSTSNNFIIRLGSTNSIYLSVRNSDKKLIFYSPAAFTGYFATAATQKIAISCDGTNWIWSSDGASGSLTATGSCNAEYITIRTDGGVGGGLPSALVNQIALFDTALTADELNSLTS